CRRRDEDRHEHAGRRWRGRRHHRPGSGSRLMGPAMNGVPFGLAAADCGHVLVTSTDYKPAAHDLARETAERLSALGVQVTLDTSGRLPLTDIGPHLGLVIAVGGDGTILNTARRLVGLRVPV